MRSAIGHPAGVRELENCLVVGGPPPTPGLRSVSAGSPHLGPGTPAQSQGQAECPLSTCRPSPAITHVTGGCSSDRCVQVAHEIHLRPRSARLSCQICNQSPSPGATWAHFNLISSRLLNENKWRPKETSYVTALPKAPSRIRNSGSKFSPALGTPCRRAQALWDTQEVS